MIMEVFRRYPEATPEKARKAGAACAVAHPDAGGSCGRPAVGEVWSIPFCEAHGLEAELAAHQEISETVGRELDAIGTAETQRWPQNKHVLEALGPIGLVPHYDHREHERLMREAYPADACRVDPDTSGFDYGADYAGGGPVDRWSASRELVVRYVREADELGLGELRDELELVRERMTAQQLLALDDYEDRYARPRRAANEARRRAAEGAKKHDPDAERLAAVNGALTTAAEILDDVSPGTLGERAAEVRNLIAEAGGAVVAAWRGRDAVRPS